MAYRDPADQREAALRYYRRNPQKIRARARQWTDEQRRLLARIVAEAKSAPCVDCDVAHPHYVMEFDHVRPGKTANIADLVGRGVSVARLRAEMSLCEVVCANCHRERTWQRRQAADPGSPPPVFDGLTLF